MKIKTVGYNELGILLWKPILDKIQLFVIISQYNLYNMEYIELVFHLFIVFFLSKIFSRIETIFFGFSRFIIKYNYSEKYKD